MKYKLNFISFLKMVHCTNKIYSFYLNIFQYGEYLREKINSGVVISCATIPLSIVIDLYLV